MPSPFRVLHHICLVVADLEASTAYYESIGIGPWHEYPPLTEYADLDVPDREAFAGLRYRWTDLDDVQLQLCQPPEQDCPQRRFLEQRGEGVFQLGFESPLQPGMEQARELGLGVLMHGRREDGSGFALLDTLDATGVALLLRQSRDAGA